MQHFIYNIGFISKNNCNIKSFVLLSSSSIIHRTQTASTTTTMPTRERCFNTVSQPQCTQITDIAAD